MALILSQHPLALVAFPAALLRVRVQRIDARTARPVAPAEAWGSGDAALLDGPMFALCPDTPRASTEAERYRLAHCDRLVYGIHVAGVFTTPSLEPSAGATLAVTRGHATLTPGWSAPPGASVAVQGYPPLVRGGRVVASNVGANAERNDRAAVGILRDGRVAFAILRADMEGFGAALAQHGDEWIYTDGGGSAYLGVDGRRLAGSTEGRRVPVWLACAGEESGSGGLLAGAVAGGVVGGAIAGPVGAAVGALVGALVGAR